MNAEKLAIIARKAALFDWLSSKGSFRVEMGWEDGDPVQFFQTFGNVNDRESEKTGEGADLASAVEAAIEAEKKRRAVISPTEIADALHGKKDREVYIMPGRIKSKGKPWRDLVFTISADDRDDARWQINHGVIIEAVRGQFGADARVTFDVRKLRRAG
jgi:hypothetical protein